MVTPLPELSFAAGAPRVAGVAFPFSHPYGPAGDADTQRAVLRGALGLLLQAPGTQVQLPVTWAADPPRNEHPRVPVLSLLLRKPWLYPRLLARSPPGPDKPDA